MLIVGGIFGFIACLGCGGVGYWFYSVASGPRATHAALVIDMRANRHAEVYDRLDEETKQSYETPANKSRFPGKSGKDLYQAIMNGTEGQITSGLILALIDGDVESITETGDTAELKVRRRGGFGAGSTTTIILKKEEGKWKVNLTKLKVR